MQGRCWYETKGFPACGGFAEVPGERVYLTRRAKVSGLTPEGQPCDVPGYWHYRTADGKAAGVLLHESAIDRAICHAPGSPYDGRTIYGPTTYTRTDARRARYYSQRYGKGLSHEQEASDRPSAVDEGR